MSPSPLSSATGGVLSELNVIDPNAIRNAVQGVIAGILGLPGGMVRPRWQVQPPRQPDPNQNWVAFGTVSGLRTDYPVIKHFPGGPDRVTRFGTTELLASVYGPNAVQMAEQLGDGFYLPQNWETLTPWGLKLYEVVSVTHVPELVNDQWIDRADLTIRVAVQTDRDYNILDLLSADGAINADDGATPFATPWIGSRTQYYSAVSGGGIDLSNSPIDVQQFDTNNGILMSVALTQGYYVDWHGDIDLGVVTPNPDDTVTVESSVAISGPLTMLNGAGMFMVQTDANYTPSHFDVLNATGIPASNQYTDPAVLALFETPGGGSNRILISSNTFVADVEPGVTVTLGQIVSYMLAVTYTYTVQR